ncbi:MAG: FHA domain-containing protein [Planctomycetota bacterium]|nr:FHA domain-containing protein [Planctomycetota bacterium]
MAAKPSSQATLANVAALVPAGSHAGNPPLPLNRLALLVGTDKHCHLHLISSTISRHHAIVITGPDGSYISDLASRTGIFVNDKEVREVILKNRDTLRLGRFVFKFTAPTAPKPVACEPAAISVNNSTAKPISGRVMFVGRHAEALVRVTDDSVSMRHAVIFESDGKRYIRDLYTRTGTFLNGKKIHQEEIKFGDEIRIGPARLSLISLASPAPAQADDSEAPLDEEIIDIPEEMGAPLKNEVPLELELPLDEPLILDEPEIVAPPVSLVTAIAPKVSPPITRAPISAPPVVKAPVAPPRATDPLKIAPPPRVAPPVAIPPVAVPAIAAKAPQVVPESLPLDLPPAVSEPESFPLELEAELAGPGITDEEIALELAQPAAPIVAAPPAEPPAPVQAKPAAAAKAPAEVDEADAIDLAGDADFGDVPEKTAVLENIPEATHGVAPHLALSATSGDSIADLIEPLVQPAANEMDDTVAPAAEQKHATADFDEPIVKPPPPADLSWARRGWRNDRTPAELPPVHEPLDLEELAPHPTEIPLPASPPEPVTLPAAEVDEPIELVLPVEEWTSADAPEASTPEPTEEAIPIEPEVSPEPIEAHVPIPEAFEMPATAEPEIELEAVESVESSPETKSGINVVLPAADRGITIDPGVLAPPEPVFSTTPVPTRDLSALESNSDEQEIALPLVEVDDSPAVEIAESPAPVEASEIAPFIEPVPATGEMSTEELSVSAAAPPEIARPVSVDEREADAPEPVFRQPLELESAPTAEPPRATEPVAADAPAPIPPVDAGVAGVVATTATAAIAAAATGAGFVVLPLAAAAGAVEEIVTSGIAEGVSEIISPAKPRRGRPPKAKVEVEAAKPKRGKIIRVPPGKKTDNVAATEAPDAGRTEESAIGEAAPAMGVAASDQAVTINDAALPEEVPLAAMNLHLSPAVEDTARSAPAASPMPAAPANIDGSAEDPEIPPLKLDLDFGDVLPTVEQPEASPFSQASIAPKAEPPPLSIESGLKFDVDDSNGTSTRPLVDGEEIFDHPMAASVEAEIFEASIAHEPSSADEPTPISGLQVRPEDFAPPAQAQEQIDPPASLAHVVEEPIERMPLDEASEAELVPVAQDTSVESSPLESAELNLAPLEEQLNVVGAAAADEVVDTASATGETLDLDAELSASTLGLDAGEADASAAVANLGDTAFGAMVEDFSGDSTGPLIEESAARQSSLPEEPVAAPAPLTEERAEEFSFTEETTAAALTPSLEENSLLPEADAREEVTSLPEPVEMSDSSEEVLDVSTSFAAEAEAAAEAGPPDVVESTLDIQPRTELQAAADAPPGGGGVLDEFDIPIDLDTPTDFTEPVEIDSPFDSALSDFEESDEPELTVAEPSPENFGTISSIAPAPEPESFSYIAPPQSEPAQIEAPAEPAEAALPSDDISLDVGDSAAIEPAPLPPTEHIPAPLPARPALKGEGFDLNDGFFNTDLSTAGVIIEGAFGAGTRTPPGSGARISRPAPSVTQVQPPRAAPADSFPQPSPDDAPMASLGGGALFTATNFEHFLGGMPVALGELPSRPQHFGKVAVNFGTNPLGVSVTEKSAAEGVPGLQGIAPPPKIQQPKPPSGAPFATHPFGISSAGASNIETNLSGMTGVVADSSKGKGKAPAGGLTTVFDGLAMPGVRERDVFSDFDIASLNDAAFGGIPLNRTDDYVLPETPEIAAKLAEQPQDDFAEDEFWNRTDEDEGLPPMGAPRQEDASVAPSGEAEVPVEETPQFDEFVSGASGGAEPQNEGTPQENWEWTGETPVAEMPADEERAVEQPPDPVADETEIFEAVAEARPSGRSVRRSATPELSRTSLKPARIEIESVPRAQRTRTRPRHLVPILLGSMLLCMGGAGAAIWYLVPARSIVVGSLTYNNFAADPGTADGDEFQAAQRRMLDAGQPARDHAIQLLHQENPKVAAGFLADPVTYEHVASTMNVASNRQSALTTLSLTYDFGTEGLADKQRMVALLKSMIDENASIMDASRRLRDIASRAVRNVVDGQAKIDQLKSQIQSLQRTVGAAPSSDEFFQLSQRQAELQRARFDAEDAVNRDRNTLARLQAAAAEAKSPPSANQPADPQLDQMRGEMADLTAKLNAAKGEESSGATQARSQLDDAVKQFNDQLTAAGVVLDDGSQLKKFVDSAKDAQVKAHQLINTLLVDGEDLEKQLEDTRRDVEELIQTRQQEKWNSDTKLKVLQENLDSAQHRYNAAVGEGIKEPGILQPIQKEIGDWTSQIKSRQADLGVEDGEVKVQDGLNKLIDSLRNKLVREKQQIDDVLDPLEKQFSDMGPLLASLPGSQQDLAKQLHDRLAALNNARRQYADAVASSGAAPSSKVTDLQKQMDDLKARFDRRQTDLTAQLEKTPGDQQGQALSIAQAKLDADKAALDAAKKNYDGIRVQYDDAAGRHEEAQLAQASIVNLNQALARAASQLEVAVQDRDVKQAQAAHSYTIKPFQETDVQFSSIDRRFETGTYTIGGLALLFAILIFWFHGASPEPIVIPASKPAPRGAGLNSMGAMRPSDPLSIPSPPSNGNGHSSENDEALTV